MSTCSLNKLKEVNALIEKIEKNPSVENKDVILENLNSAKALLEKQQEYFSTVKEHIDNNIENDPKYIDVNKNIEAVDKDIASKKKESEALAAKLKDNKLGWKSAGNLSVHITKIHATIADIENGIANTKDQIKRSSSKKYTGKLTRELERLSDSLELHYEYLAQHNEDYKQSIKNSSEKSEMRSELADLFSKKAELIAQKNEIVSTYFVGGRLLNLAPPKKSDSNDAEQRLSDIVAYRKVYGPLSKYYYPFEDDFNTFIDDITLAEQDQPYIYKSKALVNVIKGVIETYIAEEYGQGGISTQETSEASKNDMYQSMHRLMLQGKKDNYTLPDSVVTALALSTINWLSNMTDETAGARTDKSIASLVGIKETEVTIDDRLAAADVDVLLSTASNTIGQGATDLLGLKAKPSDSSISNDQIFAKIQAELGLLALSALSEKRSYNESKSLPAYVTIDKKRLGDLYIRNKNEAEVDRELFTVKMTKPFTKLAANKDAGFKRVANVAVKVSRNEHVITGPQFAPIDEDKAVAISNDFFDPSDTQVAAIKRSEAAAREVVPEYVENITEMLDSEETSTRFLKLLGQKDELEYHAVFAEGIQGKNRAIDKELQEMLDLRNEMNTFGFKHMWFNSKIITTDRFYQETNTVDPLSKKLHRFGISTGPITVQDKRHTQNLVIAFGQAFGVDVDKQRRENTIKQSTEILAKLADMYKKGAPVIDMLEMLDKGVVKDVKGKTITPHATAHALLGVVEFIKYSDYRRLNDGKINGFTTYLDIETDAVTSGIGIRNGQMPIGNDVDNTWAQTGIFTEKSKYKDFGSQAEDPTFKDAYNEPAHIMTTRLPNVDNKVFESIDAERKEQLLEPLTDAEKKGNSKGYARLKELTTSTTIGEALTEIKRSFMKDPVMTSNYGASLDSIAKTLSEVTLENFYNKVNKKDINDAITILKDLSGIAGAPKSIHNDIAALTKVKNADKSVIRTVLLSEDTSNYLKEQTRQVMGSTLKEVFEEEYGMVAKANRAINKTFAAMGELFIARLNREVEAAELELGLIPTARQLSAIRGSKTNRNLTEEDIFDRAVEINRKNKRRGKLSKEAEFKIVDSLKHLLPAIRRPLSDPDSNNQKILIIGTQRSKSKDKYSVSNSGKVTNKTTKEYSYGESSNTLRSVTDVKEYIAAVSAGAVNTIQQIDAAIQAVILSKYDVQGVHDANIWNIDNVDEGTTEYSKTFADINSTYSVVHEIMEAMFEAYNNADPQDIATVQKVLSSPFDEFPLDTVIKNIANLRNDAETGREKLWTGKIIFEHAAHPGAQHVYNGKYTRPEIKATIPAIDSLSKFKPGAETTNIQNWHHREVAKKKGFKFDNADIQVIDKNVPNGNGVKKQLHNNGEAIHSERVYDGAFNGLSKDHHYGNPFITNFATAYMREDWKKAAAIKDGYILDAGSGTKASLRYANWLEGVSDTEVQQDRRKWILEQIDSGALDNKPIIYYKDSGEYDLNHARVLRDFVKSRRATEPAIITESKTNSDIPAENMAEAEAIFNNDRENCSN